MPRHLWSVRTLLLLGSATSVLSLPSSTVLYHNISSSTTQSTSVLATFSSDTKLSTISSSASGRNSTSPKCTFVAAHHIVGGNSSLLPGNNPYDNYWPRDSDDKRSSEYSSCSLSVGSAYSSWIQVSGNPTAKTVSFVPTAPYKPVNYRAQPQFTRSYESKVFADPRGTMTFTPTGACCLQCSIYGGDVKIYHWPTSAPEPPITKLVNTKGFTFTSPSIYVEFESLYATDFCGEMGSKNNATTLAFNPDELSTTVGYRWDTSQFSNVPGFGKGSMTFTQATWEDQTKCVDTVESFWQIHAWPETYAGLSQISSAWTQHFATQVCNTQHPPLGPDQYDHYTVTYNQCSPTLAVPTRILSLNTLWSDCAAGISGFYDPPSTLTPGHGFSTPAPGPVVQGPAGPSTTEAAPGPTPNPAIPSATVVKIPAPTTYVPSSQVAVIPPPAQPTSINSDPKVVPSNVLILPDPGNGAPTFLNRPDPSQNDPLPINNPLISINPNPDPKPSPANGQPAFVPSTSQLPNDPNFKNGPPGQSPGPVNDPPSENDSHPSVPNDPNNLQPVDGAPPKATAAPAAQTNTPDTGNPLTDPSLSTEQHAYILGSQTLVAGGTAATISGVPVSLQAGGSIVVVGHNTLTLSIFLADLAGSASIVVGGKTEEVGASTTQAAPPRIFPQDPSLVIGGTTMSLAVLGGELTDTGASVVVGSQTMALGSFLAQVTGDPKVIVGGSMTMPLSAYRGGHASVLVGSSTVAIGSFLAQMTGITKAIVGGSTTMPLSAYHGDTVDASVIDGTQIVPPSVYLGQSSLTKSKSPSATENGLGNVIASLGGFTTPMASATSSSYIQAGGDRSYNGTMFAGESTGLTLNKKSVFGLAGAASIAALLL